MVTGAILAPRGQDMTTGAHDPNPIRSQNDGAPQQIGETFRNGSTTVVGVVVGFSLAFLSNWALKPGDWNLIDAIAVVLIGFGIGFQIKALSGLLLVSSLERHTYERLVGTFLLGVRFTALGVGCAIVGDVTGIGELLPVRFFG